MGTSQIKSLEDADREIRNLKEILSQTHTKLAGEFKLIERTASGSQLTIIAGNVGSSSGMVLVGVTAKVVHLTAGRHRIDFENEIVGEYALFIGCYGLMDGVIRTTGYSDLVFDNTGFSITVDQDCQLHYLPVKAA